MTKKGKEDALWISGALFIFSISIWALVSFMEARCNYCHVERTSHPRGQWSDCHRQYSEERYRKRVEDRKQWQN